jgi:ATP-dependent Lon protease
MEYDKLEIARYHLVPKQMQETGVSAKSVKFSDSAILDIIRKYTREAGVRNLERNISNICRKVAKEIVLNSNGKQYLITGKGLKGYLGVAKHTERMAVEDDQIGSATGLAWTEFGGDLLQIDVTLMKGKSGLTLTGKLGDVMKESAQAALSYIRSNTGKLGVEAKFFEGKEIHVHIPEGAIPKDGPSAGITMATAMVSALTKKPVCKSIAMTGEITLRGNVLPIGGLTEKLLAARRSGIHQVIIPEENRKDLEEIPNRVLRGLDLIFVNNMEDVFSKAFVDGQPRQPAQKGK